jgi:membrane protease YdiL (CAAX protease family)
MRRATFWGLILALVVPNMAYYPLSHFLGTAPIADRLDLGLLVHWLNLAAIVGIVVLAERQSLASIGVRPFRWWTLPAGLLAGLAIMAGSAGLVYILRLHGNQQVTGQLLAQPFLLRLLLVITAGVFEETAFRGYALERLAELTHSKWIAAAVTLGFFVMGHAPAFGWSNLAPVLVASVFVTLLYLWRRDLILNIVAHSTVDGIALLIAPIVMHMQR